MTIHITDIPNESFNHYKHVLHVDNEFALIEINKDNISDLSKFNYPYKAEAFTLCIVLKGWVKGKINSIEYNAIAPCVISIYPTAGQYISSFISGNFNCIIGLLCLHKKDNSRY